MAGKDILSIGTNKPGLMLARVLEEKPPRSKPTILTGEDGEIVFHLEQKL